MEGVDVSTVLDIARNKKSFVQELPIYSQLLLLSFGVCDRNPPSSDFKIFSRSHEVNKKSKKAEIGKSNHSKTKQKIPLSRVVGICEVFMERTKSQYQIIQESEYHSFDFYLNIDFLIQLKQIKKIKVDEYDTYFHSYVSDHTLG